MIYIYDVSKDNLNVINRTLKSLLYRNRIKPKSISVAILLPSVVECSLFNVLRRYRECYIFASQNVCTYNNSNYYNYYY